MDFRTDIVLIADDFYNAYLRCCESKNPIKIDNVIRSSVCNVPAVVNGTFALELYFKSMQPSETYGHELKILFNMLSSDVKHEIIEAVTTQLKNLMWNKTFEEYLEDINNVFVEWRYISERNYTVDYLGNKINEFLQVLKILLPIVKELTYKCKENIL